MGLRLLPILLFFVAAAGCSPSQSLPTGPGEVATDSGQSAESDRRSLDVTATDVSELVKAVESSVVTVTQTQLQLDDLRRLTEVPSGSGTGVVIDNAGHVLTNAHVVEGALKVIVVGSDGDPRSAQVVGSWAAEQNSDLALLLVDDASGLEPISMGSSSMLEVGDPVVAIGNALGLGLSVSVGIVSAVDRQVRTETSSIGNVLQTDAAINPGNSGGPLLDINGELVGINTAGISSAQNIGFAIPVDDAIPFIDYVVADAGQPFIGVSLLTVTPQVAGQFGLTVNEGAAITEVLGGSSSAEAGLKPGDVVIAIDGVQVKTRDDVLQIIETAGVGQSITLTVLRDPQRTVETTNIDVTIGAR